MIDKLKHDFISWYHNEFKADPLFRDMENTVEDSPWHRERNVGVHTDMVVSFFIASLPDNTPWDRDDVARALVCVFHDVGKPPAKSERFSEERGTYHRFSGHEHMSARMWEDYAVRNWSRLQGLFCLQSFHIYKIGWMIEYHKPWDIKKPAKLAKLSTTIRVFSWIDAFVDVLAADTHGRISDTYEKNVESGRNWASTLNDVTPIEIEPDDKPEMVMLIGASGSGKSTWLKNHPHYESYSWDALRLKWYDPDDYSNAYKLSIEDSKFHLKAQRMLIDEIIKPGKSVVIDNTNLSTKSRNFFTAEARNRKYTTTAILFPCSVDLLTERQQSRHDKTVPLDVVLNQYARIQYPLYGDFDTVEVCGDNLLP